LHPLVPRGVPGARSSCTSRLVRGLSGTIIVALKEPRKDSRCDKRHHLFGMARTPDTLSLFPESDFPSEIDVLYYESSARKSGYRLVAGVDEAGRGPLAGPVVAAAVILPEGGTVEGVKDSKAMTEKAREEAFFLINEKALAIGVGVVSAKTIDDSNILKASLGAMKKAVLSLAPAPDFLLVDGTYPVSVPTPQRCLVKGDRISLSVSAASVVAKVYRDRIMRSYHAMYPRYGFSENKGYGTAAHLAAIRAHGVCPIHRLTFRGVA
jgi:ribonuclease HII